MEKAFLIAGGLVVILVMLVKFGEALNRVMAHLKPVKPKYACDAYDRFDANMTMFAKICLGAAAVAVLLGLMLHSACDWTPWVTISASELSVTHPAEKPAAELPMELAAK